MKLPIASILACITLLFGCATPPSQDELAKLDYGPPPRNYEATIKKYFDNVLFDPYSAHYDFDQPQQRWLKEPELSGGRLIAGWFVRVSVNAKNRMGAYVGKKMYGFILKNEEILKAMDEVELQNMRQAR